MCNSQNSELSLIHTVNLTGSWLFRIWNKFSVIDSWCLRIFTRVQTSTHSTPRNRLRSSQVKTWLTYTGHDSSTHKTHLYLWLTHFLGTDLHSQFSTQTPAIDSRRTVCVTCDMLDVIESFICHREFHMTRCNREFHMTHYISCSRGFHLTHAFYMTLFHVIKSFIWHTTFHIHFMLHVTHTLMTHIQETWLIYKRHASYIFMRDMTHMLHVTHTLHITQYAYVSHITDHVYLSTHTHTHTHIHTYIYIHSYTYTSTYV